MMTWKSKLQYFIRVPKQKYRGGEGRQSSVTPVVVVEAASSGPALASHTLCRHDSNLTGREEKNRFGRETNKCTATVLREWEEKLGWSTLPTGWLTAKIYMVVHGELWREQKPLASLAEIWFESKAFHPKSFTLQNWLQHSPSERLDCRRAVCQQRDTIYEVKFWQKSNSDKFFDSLYFSNMAWDKKSLNLYKTFFFFPQMSNTADAKHLAIEIEAETTDRVKNPLQNAKKSSTAAAARAATSRYCIYIQTYIFNFHTYKKKKQSQSHALYCGDLIVH